MVQRGATNLHFSRVASSILIPPWSSRIQTVLDDPDIWEMIVSSVGDDGRPDGTVVQTVARMQRVDDEDLMSAIEARLGSGEGELGASDEDYRFDEYQALLSSSSDDDDRLALNPQDLDAYRPMVRRYFEDIVLVEKLAETRALTGFTRINPPAGSDLSVDWSSLALERKHWLPAFRVFGEGIFFTLSRDRVLKWIEKASGVVQTLQSRVNQVAVNRDREARPLPASLLLVHTLAHLLIRRLSFECGYGSSSLRERLYCSLSEDSERWMCGLLIYTAAGDSEGTMGGLVTQGKPGRFEEVLANALLDASWCSADPICRESEGQGTDSLNLAACHACCLLPETSCEEGNRLLDRLSLVGTGEEGREHSGYLSEWLAELATASD